EDGIRDLTVTGVQTCALPIWQNGAPTTTPAVPQDCSLCHLSPPTSLTWRTAQKFHASLSAPAQPSSCLDCHANSRPVALLTSGRSEERRVGKECRSGCWP